jgi:hypothetical protein
VLSLIFFLLIVWLVLCLGLAAWTVWFQNYAYLEAVDGVYWRAPLVGTILALYLCFWCVLSYRAVRADPKSPNPYATTFTFNPTRDQVYPVIWTVTHSRQPAEDGKAEEDVQTRTRYELVKTPNGPAHYRKDGLVNGAELPPRPEEIIVKDGDEEVSFKPDRDAHGNFKVEEVGGYFTPAQKKPLRYRNARGRVMEEGNLGVLTYSRTGQIIVNCLLNFVHFVVWFVCLWLLLRFQLGHSILIALACWLAMTFCVIGPLFTRAETAARDQPQVRVVASHLTPFSRVSEKRVSPKRG